MSKEMPSWDETEEISVEEVPSFEDTLPADELSTLQAAGLGAARDVTFGFSDELAGAGSALASIPSVGMDKAALLKAYRTQRDKVRELTKQAEEESPVATNIGGIGASIATLPLTGLLGAGSAVARGAQAGAKAAGLGSRIASGAKVGAAAGALSGVGQAEELSDIPESLKSGALLGASIGGALPVAGAAVRGTVNLGKAGLETATGIPGISDIVESFKYGMAGQKVAGEPAFERIGQEAIDFSRAAAKDLSKTGSALAKAQSEILKKADETTTIPIQDLIGNLESEALEKIPAVGSKAKSDISTLSQIQKDIISEFGLNAQQRQALAEAGEDEANQILQQGLLKLEATAPSVANTIKKSLSGLSGVASKADVPELRTAAGQQIAGTKAKEITNRMYSVLPELESSNKLISDFNKVMEDVGLEAVNNRILDAKDALKLRRGFFNIVKSASGETDTGIVSRDAIREMSTILKKANPELEQTLIPQIEDISQRLNLAKKSVGSGNMVGAVLTLGGRTIVAGETAGRAAGAVGDLIKKGSSGAVSAFSNLAPSQLQDLSSLISQKGTPTATKLSQKLSELASESTPETRRKAMLFSIIQNPTFRKELVGDPEEETEE